MDVTFFEAQSFNNTPLHGTMVMKSRYMNRKRMAWFLIKKLELINSSVLMKPNVLIDSNTLHL